MKSSFEMFSFKDIPDIEIESFIVQAEPTIELIDLGVKKAQSFGAELILGLGGGSSIDACKAIAALTTNGGSTKDYMEVIGKGSKITKPPLPIVAIPTTAGTGSEVTKNAVIFAKEDQLKTSIRSPLMIPSVAIIDPALMTSVPASVTATCGMDALTQLIESYTSKNAQPITDALALLGLKKCRKSLLLAFKKGDSIEAREDMALASLLSGICLANAGLGAVHGFASPMGGLQIPHGVICAALLAPTIEANIKQLIMKDPKNATLMKYAQLGEIILEKTFPSINDAHLALMNYLKDLTKELNIPTLSEFALTDSDIKSILEKVMKSSSMKYNPISLRETVLKEILDQVI